MFTIACGIGFLRFGFTCNVICMAFVRVAIQSSSTDRHAPGRATATVAMAWGGTLSGCAAAQPQSQRRGDRGPLSKRAARRPVAKAPTANGPPLAEWPERVAVAAWGFHQNYGSGDLLMIDRSGPLGSKSKMTVASPADLEGWACRYQVPIPRFQLPRDVVV